MKDNYQEEVGTQMKGLILILERTWQLAWMFYFLRIVCFAYKGFHFPVNFDCSEDGAPSACWGEDKRRVNCLEAEKGCGMHMTPFYRPSSCQVISNHRQMTDMQKCVKMAENKERNAIRGWEPGPFIFSAVERSAFYISWESRKILWHGHTHIHTF